jgi:hypothetical protein
MTEETKLVTRYTVVLRNGEQRTIIDPEHAETNLRDELIRFVSPGPNGQEAWMEFRSSDVVSVEMVRQWRKVRKKQDDE